MNLLFNKALQITRIMLRFHLFIFMLFFNISSYAQNSAIGAWNEHLPYIHGKIVADGNNKVFCATDDGLFAYLKEDFSLQRYSKLSGLNDFGVSTIEYSSTYKTLIIAYSNSNIDLVNDNGSVYNLSDIKRKNIPGNKEINNIMVKDRFAYLACGFGIVVVDLQKQEIKDTYHVTSDSISNKVWEVTADANWFYAATDKGVYRAPVTNPNLSNFNVWSLTFSIPASGYFNLIESFAGNIIANFVKTDASGNYNADTLFSSTNGITWMSNSPSMPNQNQNFSLRVSNNSLLVTNNYSVSVFDGNFSRIQFLDGNVYANTQTRDAFKDAQQTMWVADKEQGLIKWNGQSVEKIYPDGPVSSLVSDIEIRNGVLWVTHSGKDPKWSNSYRSASISKLKNNSWSSFTKQNVVAIDTTGFFDNMSLAVDRSDPEHVFIGSAGDGLMDFYSTNTQKYYRDYNSTLLPMVGNPGQVKVQGLSYDDAGNLWAVNSGVASFVNVLLTTGQWKRYSFPGVINANPFAGELFVDSYNQIWVQIYGNGADGLFVLNTNGTPGNPSDDQSKLLNGSAGTGNLPDINVYCMAEDLDGQLWLGTAKGIAVIYSPSAVFSGGNYDAQQILIKQDNSYQYLLETEIVTAIAVDGANRKWVGTQSSGLYLFSPDGQSEVHHFTPDNSPLFSNTITAISIDKITGKVFIGTDKGLVSYQSDAIEGGEACGNIIVYPNPVRQNYDGPIAIQGVVSNSNIKITDVSGTLIYEGKALGGQAIWTGRNFAGERAQTGVYLVFSTDDEGTNSCVTKLLLIN